MLVGAQIEALFGKDIFKWLQFVTCFLVFKATSIFAGFAIFSIMGHMAHVYKLPVTEVVKEGQTFKVIGLP